MFLRTLGRQLEWGFQSLSSFFLAESSNVFENACYRQLRLSGAEGLSKKEKEFRVKDKNNVIEEGRGDTRLGRGGGRVRSWIKVEEVIGETNGDDKNI